MLTFQSDSASTEAAQKDQSEPIVEGAAEKEKRDWPWKKAKKVAVMISFCGKDYLGMQRYAFANIFALNICKNYCY